MRAVLVLLACLLTVVVELLDGWALMFLSVSLLAVRGLALLFLHADFFRLRLWYRKAVVASLKRGVSAYAALGSWGVKIPPTIRPGPGQ